MALSNELISQLVKVTNDRKQDKNDVVVYGTIRDDGSRKYVQIDGSDEFTPIETTVEIEAGDRVTVDVRNHAATITGNTTNPSVGVKTAEGLRSEIKQTADEITLSIQATEDGLKGELAATSEIIRKELSDSITSLNDSLTESFNDSLNDLNDSLTNSFNDGLTNLNDNLTNSFNDSIEETSDKFAKDLAEAVDSLQKSLDETNTRVTSAESSITQTAAAIRSEVKAEVETINSSIGAINTKTVELETSITQTANKIETEVSASINGLSDEIADLNTRITQTAVDIRSEVEASIELVNGDIAELETSITQNSTSITALVKQDEEFSQFKQTVEGFEFMGKGGTVKIDGGNINLTGCISFGDLTDSAAVQSTITNAQNAADDAQDTADSALSAANGAASAASSAQTTANNASSAAGSAYSLANSIANGTTPLKYNGNTFIDKQTIYSPNIEGNDIKVYGTFQTVGIDANNNAVTTGYMGAAKGSMYDENSKLVATYGVALSTSWDNQYCTLGDSYVIVTNGGVRLQFKNNRVVVAEDGIYLTTEGTAVAKYNGVEIGAGSSVTAVWG